MIVVVVDNRIRLRGELPPETAAALKRAHEHPNPEIGKRHAMGFSTWRTPPTIHTWKVEAGELTLPRGGLGKVRQILRAAGVDFKVEDRRSEGVPMRRKLVYRGHPLRPHQLEMVRVGLAKEQCILRAATGGGKTEAAFALAAEVGLNTLIVLPTDALFKQWSERAERCLGVTSDQLGIVRGPKRRLRPLTLSMQATLGRGVPEEVRSFFGAVIVDEVQRAAADSLVRVLDALPCRYRIGVSASEKRKDRKEALIYDLFSSVAYEAGRDELTEAGYILDVEIRILPTAFRADWYGTGPSQELDYNRLLEEMVADRDRNEIALRAADAEVVAGEQVLVFTHRREHARAIDRHYVSMGVKSGLLLGDGQPGDAEEFDRTRAGIESGAVRVGVGTPGAVGYGVDLPAVSVGVAMTPVHANEQQLNQMRGRMCRTNAAAGKERGILYVLVDPLVFGDKPIRNLAAWNRNVVVWHRGAWVPAADYLRKAKRRAV